MPISREASRLLGNCLHTLQQKLHIFWFNEMDHSTQTKGKYANYSIAAMHCIANPKNPFIMCLNANHAVQAFDMQLKCKILGTELASPLLYFKWLNDDQILCVDQMHLSLISLATKQVTRVQETSVTSCSLAYENNGSYLLCSKDGISILNAEAKYQVQGQIGCFVSNSQVAVLNKNMIQVYDKNDGCKLNKQCVLDFTWHDTILDTYPSAKYDILYAITASGMLYIIGWKQGVHSHPISIGSPLVCTFYDGNDTIKVLTTDGRILQLAMQDKVLNAVYSMHTQLVLAKRLKFHDIVIITQ